MTRDPRRLTASGGWIAPRSALDALGITITDQEPHMDTPRTYVKKPVTIRAMQWDGTATGATPIINWVLTGDDTATYVDVGEAHPLRRENETFDDGLTDLRIVNYDAPAFIVIHTLEGAMRADARDWIIKGVQGEFYPCKPDIFAETYEVH